MAMSCALVVVRGAILVIAAMVAPVAADTVTPTPTPTYTCSPVETATATPSPTRTPTPTPTIDHFQCYEIHRPTRAISGVSVEDQFGPSTVDVKKAKRLCLPADKNDEDPSAPFHPDHLTAYIIHQRSPKFARVRQQIVENQFGSIIVDLRRPEMLLVPTAKSLTSSPQPPVNPAIGHFKCYRAKGANFSAQRITIDDQFGTITVDVKRPLRLCAPADKNDEGVIDPVNHLMCYKVRVTHGTPAAQPPPMVFTNNQFGPDAFAVFGPRELCVPSTKPVDLDVDTDRDATVDDDDDDGEDNFTPQRGAVLLVNLDDDDADDARDAENTVIDPNDEGDVTALDVRKSGLAVVPPNIEYVLRMNKDIAARRARIFNGRAAGAAEILGPTQGVVNGAFKEAVITPADMAGVGTLHYGMEGITYPARDSSDPTNPSKNFDGLVDVELVRRDATTKVVQAADLVRLKASPWLMLGHLQANQDVFVVRLTGAGAGNQNGPFVNDLQAILNTIGGVGLTQVTGADYLEDAACNDAAAAPCQRNSDCAPGVQCKGDQDRWMQDEIEIGFNSSPTSEMHSVFDSPRDRGLNGYPRRELLGSDRAIFEAPPDVPTGAANSLDSFGNLEVTPPLTAEGKDWLVGRIYHGGRPGGCQGGLRNGLACDFDGPDPLTGCPTGPGGFVRCNRRMQPEVRDFLAAQQIQSPVEVDSDWLDVGHVDEFISFVPFPNAGVGAKPFKVLIASPALAIEILKRESMAGNGAMEIDVLTNRPRVVVTVDDLITQEEGANTTQWQPAIEGAKCVLMARFGLVAADFIDVPVLFTSKSSVAREDRAVARLPDMVNLVVANGELIVPEPFYDPFKDDFETKLAAIGYQPSAAANPTIHFLDDFIWYHKAEGEVHCGTNSQRAIPVAPPWWTQQ